jgi:hypothetical protein
MGTIGTYSDWSFALINASEANSEATPTARTAEDVQASGDGRRKESSIGNSMDKDHRSVGYDEERGKGAQ